MFARTGTAAAWAALTACAAAVAISGCYAGGGQLQHRTRTYLVSPPVRTLVISNRVGDVQVTAGAGPVSVTERISYRRELPVTTHALRAGTLTLTGICRVSQTCDIGYRIRVPPATVVQIHDLVGNIRLTAVTGQVSAHTNAGGIALTSLSGAVQVDDHAGSVSGTGISSATATLSTYVGSIDVSFSAAPDTVTADASIGSITLRLPRGVVYAVHASAAVGSVHVTVPHAESSAHSITARTRAGSVTIGPT
jgi:Toastrack DUF4097